MQRDEPGKREVNPLSFNDNYCEAGNNGHKI
jgi:hypothetical protein